MHSSSSYSMSPTATAPSEPSTEAYQESDTLLSLDYLPYIDIEPSNDLLTMVDELIQEELTHYNMAKLHPKVASKFQDLDNINDFQNRFPDYEQGMRVGGINLSNYSNLLTEQNITQNQQDLQHQQQNQQEPELNKLKTVLTYSQLRHRTLALNVNPTANNDNDDNNDNNDNRTTDLTDGVTEINKNKWLLHLDQLKQHQNCLEQAIESKKRRIDEVNSVRKRKCVDFKPMNDFLKDRWTDKVKELVDLGVDAATKELELMDEAEDPNF